MATCLTINDHEKAKFTDDSRVRVTQDTGESWSVTVAQVTSPLITNVTTPTSGTEFTHTLSVNTKRFTLRARGNSKIQLAYISGDSGLSYVTVTSGNVYEELSLDLSAGVTIYMQTNKTGDSIEVLEWS